MTGAGGKGAAGAERSRVLLTLFLCAFALRVVALAALPLQAPETLDHKGYWDWGGEAGALTHSLLESGGAAYRDPWMEPTGPTSWLTPPYPALAAALQYVGPGAVGAVLLFLVQALASAATCVFLARIGASLGRPGVGLLAGWAFALYPIAIWSAIQVMWDTTLVAFGVVLFVDVVLRLERRPRAASLIVVGLVFGALLFLNPAPVAFAPGLLWVLATGRRAAGESWRRAARDAALVLGAAGAVLLPWSWRNHRVLGTWQPRPNLGVELMIGNHDAAHGHPEPFKYHPSHVAAEQERYVELGEAAYAAECQRRALDWIRANPGAFLVLTARRVQYFWIGDPPPLDPRRSARAKGTLDAASWLKFLSFAAVGVLGLCGLLAARLGPQGPRARRLLLPTLAVFTLPYALTHVSERYRFPLDGLLLLFALLFVVGLFRRGGPKAAAKRA